VSKYPSGTTRLAEGSEIITKPQAFPASVVGLTALTEHWPGLVPPSGTPPAGSVIQAYSGGQGSYFTNTTKIRLANHNWQGSPPVIAPALPSSHGAGSTTVVFEASDDGINWFPTQGKDSALGTGHYSLVIPQYSVEPWGRQFGIDSAGDFLVRARVTDMKSALWASISGSAEGGGSPIPNSTAAPSTVGDHTLRSPETTLNGALQYVQIYCFDTNQAGWWIRGGPWTGLQISAYVSARGTHFAEVVSTPMDGAAGAVIPAIANAAGANSVIRGFRVNCSTALVMRVLVRVLTSGSVILEADSMAA
jgi:hypothetical protein